MKTAEQMAKELHDKLKTERVEGKTTSLPTGSPWPPPGVERDESRMRLILVRQNKSPGSGEYTDVCRYRAPVIELPMMRGMHSIQSPVLDFMMVRYVLYQGVLLFASAPSYEDAGFDYEVRIPAGWGKVQQQHNISPGSVEKL